MHVGLVEDGGPLERRACGARLLILFLSFVLLIESATYMAVEMGGGRGKGEGYRAGPGSRRSGRISRRGADPDLASTSPCRSGSALCGASQNFRRCGREGGSASRRRRRRGCLHSLC